MSTLDGFFGVFPFLSSSVSPLPAQLEMMTEYVCTYKQYKPKSNVSYRPHSQVKKYMYEWVLMLSLLAFVQGGQNIGIACCCV